MCLRSWPKVSQTYDQRLPTIRIRERATCVEDPGGEITYVEEPDSEEPTEPTVTSGDGESEETVTRCPKMENENATGEIPIGRGDTAEILGGEEGTEGFQRTSGREIDGHVWETSCYKLLIPSPLDGLLKDFFCMRHRCMRYGS